MDLSKTSMGSKWRGIAKKGKRRDVGLLEPTSSLAEGKPTPNMPTGNKQQTSASVQSPSPSENPGSTEVSQESKRVPVSPDHLGGITKSTAPKKSLSSATLKNSIPVPDSNASYGKFGRNSIKVDGKHLAKLKSQKKSFAALLNKSEKLHHLAQSRSKTLPNNDSGKSNSHKLTEKTKLKINDDGQSKIDEFKKKLDHRSVDSDGDQSGPSKELGSSQRSKSKKKKCGFMRPSDPRKETKKSSKIMQKFIHFSKSAETLPDIAAISSEGRGTTEEKTGEVNKPFSSSSHDGGNKSRTPVNKMHGGDSNLNSSEAGNRENHKSSRKINSIKKLADESLLRKEELSCETPMELSRSSNSARNCSASNKASTEHRNEKHSFSDKRSEKSEKEVASANKFEKTSNQVSSDDKCSETDSFETQMTNSTSSSRPKASDKNEEKNWNSKSGHKKVSDTSENKKNIAQPKVKDQKLSIEPKTCHDVSNLDKNTSSDKVITSNESSSKNLINNTEKIQTLDESTKTTSLTDENDVKREKTHRVRNSKPHLHRDRSNERKTRSSVGNERDSVKKGVNSPSRSHKHGARYLRSHSLSSKHKVSANESLIDLCNKASENCDAAKLSNSISKGDRLEKDDVKANEDSEKVVPLDACEKSLAEKKNSSGKEINLCNEPKQLHRMECSSKMEIESASNSSDAIALGSSPITKNSVSTQLPKSAVVKDSINSSGTTEHHSYREKSSVEIAGDGHSVDETKEVTKNIRNNLKKPVFTNDSKSSKEVKTIVDESRGKNKDDEGLVVNKESTEQSCGKEKTVSDSPDSLSGRNEAEEKPIDDASSKIKKRVRLDRSSFKSSDKVKEVVDKIIKETSPKKLSDIKSPTHRPVSPEKKAITSNEKPNEKFHSPSVKCAHEAGDKSAKEQLPTTHQLDKNESLDRDSSTTSEVNSPCSKDSHKQPETNSASDSSSSNLSFNDSCEKLATSNPNVAQSDASTSDFDDKNNSAENSEKVEGAHPKSLDAHVEKSDTGSDSENARANIGLRSSKHRETESDSVETSSSASKWVKGKELLREEKEQETRVKVDSTRNTEEAEESSIVNVKLNDGDVTSESKSQSPEYDSSAPTTDEQSKTDCVSSQAKSEEKFACMDEDQSEVGANSATSTPDGGKETPFPDSVKSPPAPDEVEDAPAPDEAKDSEAPDAVKDSVALAVVRNSSIPDDAIETLASDAFKDSVARDTVKGSLDSDSTKELTDSGSTKDLTESSLTKDFSTTDFSLIEDPSDSGSTKDPTDSGSIKDSSNSNTTKEPTDSGPTEDASNSGSTKDSDFSTSDLVEENSSAQNSTKSSSGSSSAKTSDADSSLSDSVQGRNARRSSLRSRRGSALTSGRVISSPSPADTKVAGDSKTSGNAKAAVATDDTKPSAAKLNCASAPKKGRSSSVDSHSGNQHDLAQKISAEKDNSFSETEKVEDSEILKKSLEKSESVDAGDTRTSSVANDPAVVDTSSTSDSIAVEHGESMVERRREVDASNPQKKEDDNKTSVGSGSSVEDASQKTDTLMSDSVSSEESDEPTTRVLRGRVIEPKKLSVPKTTNNNVSLNANASSAKTPESLRVQLKPVVRLISDTTLPALVKAGKSSLPKKPKGTKPSIPKMKDCLVVSPPATRLQVLVTDDRKAVPMNKRQHRGQLVLVTHVERNGILDISYSEDGKIMRYPLRKSKASETHLFLDSPEPEEKEQFKASTKERDKSGPSSTKQSISSANSSGTDTGDRKPTVLLIKTKHVSTAEKLEVTSSHPARVLDSTPSPRSLSPIAKLPSKSKDASNDHKQVCEPEVSTSRGATPQPSSNDADTSLNRSKRQPKASQKLLESFESGSFELFKNMSKLVVEKPSNEVSALKSNEKSEEEGATSKAKDKQIEGENSQKTSSKDASGTASETSELSKSLKVSGDSGGGKEIVRKKRVLEDDSSDACPKKKKKNQNSDINTVCCGVDYKSSFDLQRHMVKKARDGDSNHIKKLRSRGYDKCARCPAWIRASMMAIHLQNIHNESSHASTKLQIQTTVIKLKKQTVPGKNIFKENSENETLPSLVNKSCSSKVKPFVDLGERISVSESNVNSDENEENIKIKSKRGKKPALKGILCNKQNEPKNKSLQKKSVTLKSPDRESSTSNSNSGDSEEDSDISTSSSSETSSRRYHSKKKKLKKRACTIDSFDDRDNYKPTANVVRGLEPLSEHSFVDHSENNRAQIKTKLSLRSSRRCPDTISPLLEKNAFARRKLSSGNSWRKGSLSSSDEQSTESDDETSDSDRDSSSSSSGDDKENVPLVELDMFTFPSDEYAMFLIDPKNPKLKIYTCLDTIFVSDASLGNGKKQVSYRTENNNIIYANHNHPVFPNPHDLQNHIPRPLLVMKMAKLGTSNEKNTLTAISSNVLKDSNSSSSNRQSSSVNKVTELLSELICKSVNSPRNRTLKSATILKSSALDCVRAQLKPADENVTPNAAGSSSRDQQHMPDTGSNLHRSPVRVQSTVDASNSSILSSRKSKALGSPSVPKNDMLAQTAQQTSKSASGRSHEGCDKSVNSTREMDLLQQVISSTISSPLGLESYDSHLDSFSDAHSSDLNLSSTLSADEIISYANSDSNENEAPLTPAAACASQKQYSTEPLLSGKNIHVIRKSLSHSPNKIVLKASGTSSSSGAQVKSPSKIKVTKQVVPTASSAAAVSDPTSLVPSVHTNSTPTHDGDICPSTSEPSHPSTSFPAKTNTAISPSKLEKLSLPDLKEGASSVQNLSQESSRPQKSAWSFLDDDSDEFLATLEFTDTLQSPTCLDSSDGNDSSDSRQKDLISSVKLPDKLPSLVIGDEDFESVFDESDEIFFNQSADEETDSARNDSPKLEESTDKAVNQKSLSNSSTSKRDTMSPCEPTAATPPLEPDSRPTFISPPSRKRLQCFDETEGSSPSRTYSKLAYSALSDNDIFGLWPSGASPKVSHADSPARESASQRHKRKRRDSPLIRQRRFEEKRLGHSSLSSSKSLPVETVSDERTVASKESELNSEKLTDMLSSTRVPETIECDSTNISENPTSAGRRSSTSNSSAPATNSSQDSLADEISNFSPVHSGNQTPKGSKIKLAVSFDDGSVPLEFSLDSIRKKDASRQRDKLDDSLASGNASSSTIESPLLAGPSKRIDLGDRSAPVQLASDDERACISRTDSPSSQHEMKSKKSSKRKEKKSKSKKKKKEKHRHHSPVRLPPDNQGIRMKINLKGMTSEVMNNEAPKARAPSLPPTVFDPLIEASKVLGVVPFERPSADEIFLKFSSVNKQRFDSLEEFQKMDPQSSPLDGVEQIDVSQFSTADDTNLTEYSDRELEQDPLSLENYSQLSGKKRFLSSQTNFNESESETRRSLRDSHRDSEMTGMNSPQSRKRKHSKHFDAISSSKKFKHLRSEVGSNSEDFISDDASCVSPDCLSRDAKPSVDSASPSRKSNDNALSSDDGENESITSPRPWLGRGAKLRAAVLIQDQQEGITDSQVLSPGRTRDTDIVLSPTKMGSPRSSQLSELNSSKKTSHSPPMASTKSRRSSTSVSTSKNLNHVSPKHSTPIVRRSSADGSPSDDRTWHSRGAKLKAQVLISDLQSGVDNSSVIAPDTPKSTASESSQAVVYSRNDIRYFFQPKKKTPSESSQSPSNMSSETRSQPDITSFLLHKHSKDEPSQPNERKKSDQLSEPDCKLKDKQEVQRRRPTPSATDINIPVNNLKCWYESRCSKQTIAAGSIPPGPGNFVGFDSLEPYSGARAQTLRHVITLSNMKKWSQQSNLFPVPVDQIFDWDEEELVSALNL